MAEALPHVAGSDRSLERKRLAAGSSLQRFFFFFFFFFFFVGSVLRVRHTIVQTSELWALNVPMDAHEPDR